MKAEEPVQDLEYVSDESLVKIALFLEGMKLGRGGNITPLGNRDLEQLWNAVSYLRGNVRYKAKKDEN